MAEKLNAQVIYNGENYTVTVGNKTKCMSFDELTKYYKSKCSSLSNGIFSPNGVLIGVKGVGYFDNKSIYPCVPPNVGSRFWFFGNIGKEKPIATKGEFFRDTYITLNLSDKSTYENVDTLNIIGTYKDGNTEPINFFKYLPTQFKSNKEEPSNPILRVIVRAAVPIIKDITLKEYIKKYREWYSTEWPKIIPIVQQINKPVNISNTWFIDENHIGICFCGMATEKQYQVFKIDSESDLKRIKANELRTKMVTSEEEKLPACCTMDISADNHLRSLYINKKTMGPVAGNKLTITIPNTVYYIDKGSINISDYKSVEKVEIYIKFPTSLVEINPMFRKDNSEYVTYIVPENLTPNMELQYMKAFNKLKKIKWKTHNRVLYWYSIWKNIQSVTYGCTSTIPDITNHILRLQAIKGGNQGLENFVFTAQDYDTVHQFFSTQYKFVPKNLNFEPKYTYFYDDWTHTKFQNFYMTTATSTKQVDGKVICDTNIKDSLVFSFFATVHLKVNKCLWPMCTRGEESKPEDILNNLPLFLPFYFMPKHIEKFAFAIGSGKVNSKYYIYTLFDFFKGTKYENIYQQLVQQQKQYINSVLFYNNQKVSEEMNLWVDMWKQKFLNTPTKYNLSPYIKEKMNNMV